MLIDNNSDANTYSVYLEHMSHTFTCADTDIASKAGTIPSLTNPGPQFFLQQTKTVGFVKTLYILFMLLLSAKNKVKRQPFIFFKAHALLPSPAQ